jgi:hypothetical protein
VKRLKTRCAQHGEVGCPQCRRWHVKEPELPRPARCTPSISNHLRRAPDPLTFTKISAKDDHLAGGRDGPRTTRRGAAASPPPPPARRINGHGARTDEMCAAGDGKCCCPHQQATWACRPVATGRFRQLHEALVLAGRSDRCAHQHEERCAALSSPSARIPATRIAPTMHEVGASSTPAASRWAHSAPHPPTPPQPSLLVPGVLAGWLAC